MRIKDLLPIGSIVFLKDSEKRLMIIGVMQSDASKNWSRYRKEYDYLGVLYPEGYIGNHVQYLFNHEDIREVVFRGFEDTESNEFRERLASLYEH